MKDKTLLILAAGMGSRFGGLKQTEKFGPSGEFIIDYSIYDAIRAGFNKIVFVIKEENYELFRETIGKRVENHVNVEYVFQNFDNVPSNFKIPEDRVKPLGTAQAVLCAKDVINEPFAVIGADDFYGYDAFKVLSDFIDTNPNDVGVVGYRIVNTLTEFGSVKRGVLFTTDNNDFVEIIESVVEEKDGVIEATALSDGTKRTLDISTKTSMIMSCFPANFFDFIESEFRLFLETSDLTKDEFYLPNVITEAHNKKEYKVKVVDTNAKWVGVTYKEDTPLVKNYLQELVDKGEYHSKLWE